MSSGLVLRFLRRLGVVAMLGLAGTLMVTDAANARAGGGGSFGSRASRTWTAPSATPTAPSVSPIQRSTTPSFGTQGGFNSGFGAQRPGGFFSGGFGRGLLGGFLGAGLFGMLFGNGLFGGLGGGTSIIGLLLQLALLYFGVKFLFGMFRGRQPAFGGQGFGPSNFGFGGQPGQGQTQGSGGFGMGGGAPQTTPITIEQVDYQAFERRLVESQLAYSNGDVGALRRLATPEMAGNFERELAENARQGVTNKLADVRLLSGDLSEAWRENGTDYATVAMRFSLVDATIDQRSGNVVSGSSTTPQQVTEVWTFQRPAGAGPEGWTLAAIQQTS